MLSAAGRFSGDVHNIRRSSLDREGGLLSLNFKEGSRHGAGNLSGLPICNFLRSVQSGAHRVVRNANRGNSHRSHSSRSSGSKQEQVPEAGSEVGAAVAAEESSALASMAASVDAMQARSP